MHISHKLLTVWYNMSTCLKVVSRILIEEKDAGLLQFGHWHSLPDSSSNVKFQIAKLERIFSLPSVEQSYIGMIALPISSSLPSFVRGEDLWIDGVRVEVRATANHHLRHNMLFPNRKFSPRLGTNLMKKLSVIFIGKVAVEISLCAQVEITRSLLIGALPVKWRTNRID